MSYCRFSSDNWRSDVYAYESCYGGFTTHVAGNRLEGDTPIPEMPVDWHKLPVDELVRLHEAQSAWIDHARHVPIGLQCDGETFQDETVVALRSRLLWLRELGYLVPDATIAMLDAEIAEAE